MHQTPSQLTMQPPVSFVVIGRNQVSTICACIASVRRAAQAVELESYETFYVDSDSTDRSIESVMEQFGDSVSVLRLTGARNAAVARNVGAAHATGRVLFFVDGDMEVDSNFLHEALGPGGGLVHPVVTGQLPEKIYDIRGVFLHDAPDRYRIRNRRYRAELGGVFLIERELFRTAGGFATELRCNEDIDLGLRLARMGVLTLTIPRPIALHHTVDYFEWGRLARMVRDGNLLYPGAIFRRHIANRYYLPGFLSNQRSTLILLLSATLGIIANPAWLLLYPGYLAAKNMRQPTLSLAKDMVGTTARSIGFLLGIIIFYPKKIPTTSIVAKVC